MSQWPAICLTLLISSAVVGCGSNKSVDVPTVRVPPVDTTSLGAALEALGRAHLRVELTGFGPLPAGYGLDGAGVGDQEPEAPTLVPEGSVVHLTMSRVNPIPSPVVLKPHPPTVRVPRLIGLSWEQARSRIPEGFWLQIGHVPAVAAMSAGDVFSSYVVTGQSPPAGTELPFGGVLLAGNGYRPSVVRLTIGVR